MKTQPYDFLPAALAVQELPPSPIGRWLGWCILAAVAAGLVWASMGEVDIVVSAPGRLVPNGQVKLVQAPETGLVEAIYVAEGERVNAGQLLLRMDSTSAAAEDIQLQRRIQDVSLQIGWRHAFERWLEKGRKAGSNPAVSPDLPAELRLRASSLLEQKKVQLGSTIASLEKERESAIVGRRISLAETDKVEATLRILFQRVSAHEQLLEKQYGSRSRYLELLQEQTALERSVPMLEARANQQDILAAALEARIASTLGQERTENLMELTRLTSELAFIQQDARKTHHRRGLHDIRAPVTGTIQELVVHTEGAIVTPAQQLMKIVPTRATLEVEAFVTNRDVGFLISGQQAAVKVSTFNFTKYGLLDAVVADISDDAVQDQRLGWVFKMRLTLDSDTITVGDRLVKLSPGMSVTAEIKTGQRRLIEFFLSPLLRYRQESIRER